jgi:hypothetical protein
LCDFQTIVSNVLNVKNVTETRNFLDLQVEIDNGCRLETELYENRDNFTYPIGEFLPISNISI